MGLFGRDDRSDTGNPPAADPQSRAGAAPASGSAVTLIAKPIRFDGRIEGSGEVRIEGSFKGKLDSSAQVVVAQGGEVEAELRADLVTVAGRVRGNIFAGKKIELTPSADVQGDITAPRILIREGATFEGQVNMSDPAKKRTAGPAEKPVDATGPEGAPEPKPEKK